MNEDEHAGPLSVLTGSLLSHTRPSHIQEHRRCRYGKLSVRRHGFDYVTPDRTRMLISIFRLTYRCSSSSTWGPSANSPETPQPKAYCATVTYDC
jgi:hypothetical protein